MEDLAINRFGFRIRPVEGRWEWVAAGQSGYAPSRAAAAAAVIHALAATAAPQRAFDRAA